MKRIFIIFLITYCHHVHSQNPVIDKPIEINISTKFGQYGSLYENISNYSPMIAEFNKGQKCVVLQYFGNNNYKIEYKNWIGFVTSEYLVINKKIKGVLKAYEENKKLGSDKKELKDELRKPVEDNSKIEEGRQNQMEPKLEAEKEQKRIVDSLNLIIQKYEKEKAQRRITDSLNQLAKLRTRCDYQINEIDDFNHTTIVRTEKYRVNNNLEIELYKKGNSKQAFFSSASELGCVSYFSNNRSSVKITLENNDIVTVYHSWNMDCGNFSLKGVLTNDAISKLEKSPIKSIRLQGTKQYLEIETIEYKEFFMDKLHCLD